MRRQLLVGAALLGWSSLSLAQDKLAKTLGAGDLIVQAGYFHIDTRDSSGPVRTELRPSPLLSLFGVPEQFTSEGTGLSISSADTPALTAKYFLTDQLSLQLEGGIPADFDTYGHGTVAPPGAAGEIVNADLGDPHTNPVASSTQWSPTVILHWNFRAPDDAVRPYIGVGAVYTWFTDVEVSDSAAEAITSSLGTALALAAGIRGDTDTTASSSSSVDPVINIGTQVQLTARWGLSLSASYLPLETTSTIKIKASDGTTLATNKVDIDIHPVVIALLVNYRF